MYSFSSLPRPALVLFTSFILLFSKSAFGAEYRISTESKFSTFIKNINKKINYLGTTVYLDSDLSLPNVNESIGKSPTYQFRGTFDGQGYIISDLNINSSISYSGLFAYSGGSIIRNVILDSSCSITGYGSGYAYVGGVFGSCYANNGDCTIENSVNMASVTYKGESSSGSYIYLGGISGRFSSSSNYKSVIKNCANYGAVTHSGIGYALYIGGIVGDLGSSDYYKYIYNSINYDTITHNGTTTNILFLGGIVGHSWSYGHVENCVSAGDIVVSGTYPKSGYIKSIVGYIKEYSFTCHNCYHTDVLSKYGTHGYSSPSIASNILSYNSTTFELNESASVGSYTGNSLIDALNAYADHYPLRDYSRWVLNKGGKSVSFTINSRGKSIALDYQVILLPNLANEGKLCFDGWYDDSGCTSLFTESVVTSDTALHGKFEENTNQYTVTFDSRGGPSVSSRSGQAGTVVSLQSNLVRDNCSFEWWENEYGDDVGTSFTIPARSTTLYAVWKCTRITTPDDLVAISKIVNAGKSSFNGTTVFLDSDIDLSGKEFEPIGSDFYGRYFKGTFDGQGHTINNLIMNSSSMYTGLFGYSAYSFIRNTVLDSSCSVTSRYSGSNDNHVGGFVGECGSYAIENCVNMASVTLSNSTRSRYLSLGGIVGYFFSCNVKNCVNYGAITHLGVSITSYIGGIAGYPYASYSGYVHIQNSLNYGTITHSGITTNTLYAGGISGSTYYRISIENCVNAGEIILVISALKYNYIGAIMGSAFYNGLIDHCYYTDELSTLSIYGSTSKSYPVIESSAYNSTTLELEKGVLAGNRTEDTLVGALNAAADKYELNAYSRWILNKDKKQASFTVDGRKLSFTLNSQVILLPNLLSEWNVSFDGWYTDDKYASPFTDSEVTSDTELYGRYVGNTDVYTVAFDSRGGAPVASRSVQFGTNITLPDDLTRDGCTIVHWETDKGYNVGFNLTVPARDITLYAVWKCTHIKTPEDFLDFAKIVNAGSSYLGTTVYLSSDLSLSGALLEQIGKDDRYYFNGTFDGQGYVVSNFTIASSSTYVGLFGYSFGLTIRNVVLDSFCSITNSHNVSSVSYTGGIVGYCKSAYGKCVIENSVNMGSVEFNGNYYAYLGGVVGYLYYNKYQCYVKNCANYGALTHSGVGGHSYMGGIAGYSYGSSKQYNHILNCFNHGTIAHNGTTSNGLYVGGITGYAYYYTSIENCVNVGMIFVPSTILSSNKYIGSIAGYASRYVNITHCFWTSDVGCGNASGFNGPTIDSETSQIEASLEVVDKLNNYSAINSWSRWLLNANNFSVLFNIYNEERFATKSQIVFIPDLINNGERSFSGWYEDEFLSTPLVSSKVGSDAALYGMFCALSSYAVSLDVNGGNESSIPSSHPMGIECNGLYGVLPTAGRTGYTFDGWYTKSVGGTLVESGNRVVETNDHTLYAQWGKVTARVEIVFETKDMNDEEIRTIIERYVDAKFTIIRTEDSETGETRIIIKFADVEKAEEFVRNVRSGSGAADSMIKRVRFNSENPNSFSLFYPLLSFIILIL